MPSTVEHTGTAGLKNTRSYEPQTATVHDEPRLRMFHTTVSDLTPQLLGMTIIPTQQQTAKNKPTKEDTMVTAMLAGQM